MKLTNREKNSIISTFAFYILIFFILLYFALSYFYPEIIKIEAKKIETQELYDTKTKTEKEWISLSDFKKLNKNTKDTYFENILQNLDKEFYNENFINNEELSFDTFINKKIDEVNSDEYINNLMLQDLKISKVLPSYNENNVWNQDNIISNFKFVNYVESIISTFELKTTDKIWINNIVLLKDYQNLNGPNSSIESNIFAIPLKLSLEWKKAKILDFLNFANNVWKIIIDEGRVDIYKDEYFNSNQWWQINLKWDYDNDNIYKNQLFDIEYIKYWEYIDSSLSSRKSKEFIDFIKGGQSNQDYKIDVQLNFYVKWIEQYELISYIKGIINHYNTLNTNINKKLSDKSVEKYDEINYKKAKIYLAEISKDIKNINKDLNKKENLEQLYNKAINLNISFMQIDKLIN